MITAALLKGRKCQPHLSFGVVPGTRQVLKMIAENGALTDIVDSGARILESTCGFCVGYGQSPHSGAVSLRTNNRNFEGRSGTKDAAVYLVSPESAVAAALTGKITDPRDMGVSYPAVEQPAAFAVDDSMFIRPSFSGDVFRGPNMGDPPQNTPMPRHLETIVTIKLGEKITTDHIMPAGSVSRYRSNIQKSSEFLFKNIDPDFAQNCERVKSKNMAAIIVTGASYGQGSSREHAAVCPMYLGVRAVIAKSIERIHMGNLVNFGIIPLIFKETGDYEHIQQDDQLEIADTHDILQKSELIVTNKTRQKQIPVCHSLTTRQAQIVLQGGLLNYIGNH